MNDQTTPKKKRLQRKENAFIKEILTKPDQSNAQAIVNAGYNVSSMVNASNMANQLLNKPHIQSELAKHNNLVEDTIIDTIAEYKDSPKQWQRSLAVDSAFKVHDKIHGKARQQVELQSTSIKLSIDLSSALLED